MKKLLLLFFLTNVFVTHGQTIVGIKLYQNTDMFERNLYGRHNVTNFDRISFALSFSKERIAHEIEFFVPEIREAPDKYRFPFDCDVTVVSGHDIDVSTFSFRYEVMKNFSGSPTPVSFFVGLGANPYWVDVDFENVTEFEVYNKKKECRNWS